MLFDHLRLRPGLPIVLRSVDPSSGQADTDLGCRDLSWLDNGHFTRLGDDTILGFAELFEGSFVGCGGCNRGVGVRNIVLGGGLFPELSIVSIVA